MYIFKTFHYNFLVFCSSQSKFVFILKPKLHDFYKLGNQKPRNAVSGRGRSFLRSERAKCTMSVSKSP